MHNTRRPAALAVGRALKPGVSGQTTGKQVRKGTQGAA